MTLAAEEQANPPSPPPQSRNHLLAVVPPSEFLELQTHLTPVDLRPRQRLSESNQDIEAVYFPHDTVLSMAAVDRDGGTIEVASVGCEGMAGLPVLLGADQSTNRVSVQIGGRADRMDASVLRREARRHEEFGRLLHLYTQAFMTQIAQSTACNRLHSAEQRLARWLLICRDRVQRDELPITQETKAAMLVARRWGVFILPIRGVIAGLGGLPCLRLTLQIERRADETRARYFPLSSEAPADVCGPVTREISPTA